MVLDHAVCDPKDSLGYVNRFIISFGIALGVRPNAMWEFTNDQFTNTSLKGKDAYVYTEGIGSRSGGSKTKKGCIKYITKAPVQIPLCDIVLFYVRLIFFIEVMNL